MYEHLECELWDRGECKGHTFEVVAVSLGEIWIHEDNYDAAWKGVGDNIFEMMADSIYQTWQDAYK